MKKIVMLICMVSLFLTGCISEKKDEKQNEYRISITVLGNGDVTPKSGGYKEGETIVITAKPNAGNVFKNWGGDISGTSNPITVKIAGDMTIEAIFEKEVIGEVGNTGLIPISEAEYKSLPIIAGNFDEENLPASYDLTPLFPIPGNQGHQNSCVGWAIAYALKTFQEGEDYRWDVNSNLFSPAYIYNQINGGIDKGSSIRAAMNILLNQGCAKLEDMPYNSSDYLTQPSEQIKIKAADYKILQYGRIEKTQIKSEIASRNGVIAAIPTYPDFDTLTADNPIYDNADGTIRGHHAICIIGYRDDIQAYKFINSWGNSWGIDGGNGQKGYGYIAYSFVEKYVNELYIMRDIKSNIFTNYSLSISSSTGGRVNIGSGQYKEGSIVKLEATAESGYEFGGWSGDISGMSNPYNLTMNSNKTVRANFIKQAEKEYSLSISSSTGGQVNIGSGQYKEGSVVTIEATAESGYEFTGWSGDISGMSNPYSITMNSNKTVKANFVISKKVVSSISVQFVTQEAFASGVIGDEVKFYINSKDNNGNLIDCTSNIFQIIINGVSKNITATRLSTGKYEYKLRSSTPTMTYFKIQNDGVVSGEYLLKFYNYKLTQSLPVTTGSTTPKNIMMVTYIGTDWLGEKIITVKKTSGNNFTSGGRIVLVKGGISGSEVDSFDITTSNINEINLYHTGEGTYYVKSGDMYVGPINIVKNYQ